MGNTSSKEKVGLDEHCRTLIDGIPPHRVLVDSRERNDGSGRREKAPWSISAGPAKARWLKIAPLEPGQTTRNEIDRESKQKSLLRAALSGRMEGRIAALRSGSHLRAWSRRQLGGWREVERDLPVTQRAWLPMQASLPMFSGSSGGLLVTDGDVGVWVRLRACLSHPCVSSSRGRVNAELGIPQAEKIVIVGVAENRRGGSWVDVLRMDVNRNGFVQVGRGRLLGAGRRWIKVVWST